MKEEKNINQIYAESLSVVSNCVKLINKLKSNMRRENQRQKNLSTEQLNNQYSIIGQMVIDVIMAYNTLTPYEKSKFDSTIAAKSVGEENSDPEVYFAVRLVDAISSISTSATNTRKR